MGQAAPGRVIGAGPGDGGVCDSTGAQLARGVAVVDAGGLHFRLETPGLRPAPGAGYFREAERISRRY